MANYRRIKMFSNKASKSICISKQIYLRRWDLFVIISYLVIMYFAISACVFVNRNPLARLDIPYLKHPIKIMKFEKMKKYQYSYENFMKILEREDISCK